MKRAKRKARKLRRFLKMKQVTHAMRVQESQPSQEIAPAEQHAFLQQVNLELGYALSRFLYSSDWITACEIIADHPLLVGYSACETLELMTTEARKSGNEADEIALQGHLAVLELARRKGVAAVKEALIQPNND